MLSCIIIILQGFLKHAYLNTEILIMQKTLSEKFVAAIGALVAWVAIILQLTLILQNRVAGVPETIIRFFSFFTILTNIIVAISFTETLLAKKISSNNFWQRSSTKTAVVIYILVVGIIYNLVLRQLWVPVGLQKVADELLHVVTPILYLFYWIVFVPKQNLHWRFAIQWLWYPFFYLFFILVRGAFSDFYPYPFVDVLNNGYKKVFINSVYVLLLFLVLSVIFIGASRLTRTNTTIG